MTERKGLLPMVTSAAFGKVQKEIDTKGKGYMNDLLTRMTSDNNYLAHAIFMEGDVIQMDYNPEQDADPAHVMNSAYLIYGLLEAEAKLQQKKLPRVTEEIDLLLMELEDSLSMPRKIIENLREDNPMLLGTIEQRATESRDSFKEIYVMTRTYRLLECAAEYEGKWLIARIPDMNTIN